MGKWNVRPARLQMALALATVGYIASLWLFPGWDSGVGLQLVLGLGLAAGIYTFVGFSREARARSEVGSQRATSLVSITAEDQVTALVFPEAEPASVNSALPEQTKALPLALEITRHMAVAGGSERRQPPPRITISPEGHSQPNLTKRGDALA